MHVVPKTNLQAQSMVGFWRTTRFHISLQNPLVMGIVNATPDSFSSSDSNFSPADAIHKAQLLLREGADVLDIGGESTRPGAIPLTHEQEWQRIEPVLRELVTWQVPLSVDTYHPENMQKSLDLGVDIINDVWALRQANALEIVSKYDCGVCLMHMHGNPLTMQLSPMQEETLEPVFEFLQMQTQLVQSHGVAAHRIVIDPGIGFGKTVTQNFDILQRQKLLLDLGFPVMVGWSRKSSLGKVTGLDVADRCVPSVVAAMLAIERGAKIVRVHDVAQTVSALAVWKNAPAFM